MHDILRLAMDSTAPAPEPKPRAFFAGARLVWTRQRILWWIFVVNAVFSFSAARGLAEDAGAILNHSLESSRRFLYEFDVSAIAELSTLPSGPLRAGRSLFLWPSIFFAIFMLFVTGGVLVSYHDDLRLDAAGFFEASGRHFWRFVRLAIYFAIVMIPIALLGSMFGKLYDNVDDAAVSPYSAPVFLCVASLVVLFLVVCVRIWFDMAQVIAMAKDERRMYRALRRSASLVRNNFGSLFWLYTRISVLGLILFGAGLYVWMTMLKPESTLAAFVVSQAMVVIWLGTRLWQRASETEWYKQYRAAQYAPVPMPAPPPVVPAVEVEILR